MKVLMICAGFLLLALGAVGVFVPVLPTTPFVLLAAACFGSASPKLYKWLAGTRFFGPFIENYKQKNGVPARMKALALCFLWPLLVLSMVLTGKLWVIALLTLVGAAVSAHILLIKTRR
jgi:uncharacterized membrane protein YbaN (DUF454 family)